MKKILFTFIIFTVCCLFFPKSVYAADPHLELSPSSGVAITESGTDIDIVIDTGDQAVKSSKAVVLFEPSLVEVISVTPGTFFDDVSHNIYNPEGQVVVNGNLSLDSMLESKTGTGVLATMTVKAVSCNGPATMIFDCTDGDSTDSNIQDTEGVDIIVCTSNVGGEYDLCDTDVVPTAPPEPTSAPVPTAPPPNPPIPQTGIVEPTIALLFGGLLLLFAPVFL